MSENGNKEFKDIELGNTPENLEKFDKCTLNEHYCGFKTKDGFCLNKDRCAYKLSEKYFQKLTESTIETILRLLKEGKIKTYNDILAITPESEIETEIIRDSENKPIKKLYIVDSKGNVLDVFKLRIIRRKY